MNDETNMSAAVPPRSSKSAPDWQLLRDGCPGGESPAEIGARADRVANRVRAVGGDVLVLSSGHILCVLVARWLGLEAAGGALLSPGHRRSLHPWIRAQPRRAGYPAVERHPSSG